MTFLRRLTVSVVLAAFAIAGAAGPASAAVGSAGGHAPAGNCKPDTCPPW